MDERYCLLVVDGACADVSDPMTDRIRLDGLTRGECEVISRLAPRGGYLVALWRDKEAG